MADVRQANTTTDLTGYGLAIAGATLFSTKGIFIKLAYQAGIGTETVLALRMVIALPFYLTIGIWLLTTDKTLRTYLTPRVIIGAALVGSLGYYVAASLDFWGLYFLTAQYERLVLFTYPFFVLALGVWFFGDKMNWRTMPGLLVSYSGLLVIFGWNLVANPDGLWQGTALVLTSAISFAFYQHFAKAQMVHIGSRLFTCIGMGTAGIIAITHNTIQHGTASYMNLSGNIWLYALCLGILGTVLPSFFLNGAIQRIGARATASTAAVGPITTIALAVIILGESFTPFHAVGTALVITGVILFSRAERKT